MRYIIFSTAIFMFLSFDCNGQRKERDTIFFASKKGELFLHSIEYANGAKEYLQIKERYNRMID